MRARAENNVKVDNNLAIRLRNIERKLFYIKM